MLLDKPILHTINSFQERVPAQMMEGTECAGYGCLWGLW